MARIENFSDFKSTLSFNELCSYFLDDIFDVIRQNYPDKPFLIGYHIRHFLDSDAPTYLAKPSDKSKQTEVDLIIERNKNEGKYTINHIIDNLYYKKENSKRNTIINLQFTFDNEHTTFKKLKENEFSCINAEANINSIRFSTAYNIASDIEKLVNRLNLDPNFENIKSIFNAIDQIRTYEKFGKLIQCLIIRPGNQFGFVIGISLISNEMFDMSMIKTTLLNHFKQLNTLSSADINTVISKTGNTSSIINKIRNYKPFRIDFLDNKIPSEFYEKVIGIDSYLKEYVLADTLSHFKKTVESFIELLSHFCDEKIEGNPLTYGFVLGNPGLLNFLKDNNLFPSILNDSQDKFSNIDSIKSNIHLFSNHEISSIVIPYLDEFQYYKEDEPLPTFILPMKNFEEDIFNWDEGNLIPATYRPYAFLSYRFPWLISAIVGPHSQIRLFKGGKIVAYKDGKGWKSANLDDSLMMLKEFKSNEEKARLKKFIDFAKLFSPIYNPNSHGGFITYVEGLDTLAENDILEYRNSFEPLVDKTPKSHNGHNWLIGEDLFDSSGKDKSKLNIKVCSKLLQTCVLDGAISIEGSDYSVKTFGNRLIFKIADENLKDIRNDAKKTVSGTKRKTAMEFVKWCSSKNLGKYFAIAISSDGPIRIFYDRKDKKGKKVLSDITIFELMKEKRS